MRLFNRFRIRDALAFKERQPWALRRLSHVVSHMAQDFIDVNKEVIRGAYERLAIEGGVTLRASEDVFHLQLLNNRTAWRFSRAPGALNAYDFDGLPYLYPVAPKPSVYDWFEPEYGRNG